MRGLKHDYPAVERAGSVSYGGNQGWSRSAVIRKSGCGLIAATDLLLYLHQNRPGFRSQPFFQAQKGTTLTQEAYERISERLRRSFFPVIPWFGKSGLGIAMGLNAWFRTCRLPMRARWCVWGEELWTHIEQMLDDDLPVILTIGQNIPCFWMKRRVRLYEKVGEGRYRAAAKAKAHHVVVTRMGENWIKVSSWGKEYYIDRREYEQYVKKYSSYFVSNIVFLKHR